MGNWRADWLRWVSTSSCSEGAPGLRFAVRVKPGARRAAVGGSWHGSAGTALIVAVSAPAVEGKANEAVRRALATAFGVRRQDVVLVAGERGRDKLVEISPAPGDAARRLADLLSL